MIHLLFFQVARIDIPKTTNVERITLAQSWRLKSNVQKDGSRLCPSFARTRFLRESKTRLSRLIAKSLAD